MHQPFFSNAMGPTWRLKPVSLHPSVSAWTVSPPQSTLSAENEVTIVRINRATVKTSSDR